MYRIRWSRLFRSCPTGTRRVFSCEAWFFMVFHVHQERILYDLMWLKDVSDVCRHRSDTGQLERRLWAEAVEEVEAKPRARNSGSFMLQICVSIVHCTQKRLYNRLRVMSYACVSAVVTVCPKLFSVGFCTLLCVAVPLLVKTWEGSWQRLVNSCLSDKSLSPILDHFCWHFSLDIALAFSYFPAKYAAEPHNLRIFISIPIPPAPSPSLLQKISNKTFVKAQGTVKSQTNTTWAVKKMMGQTVG